MEGNVDVKISLSTFVKLNPWDVKPVIVRDTCCRQYHVKFQLYYEIFPKFGIQYRFNDPPPSSVCDFLFKILCAQENNQLFYKKECVDRRKCKECSHLALFDASIPLI